MKVPATQWYAAALQALFEYLAGLGSNGSLIVSALREGKLIKSIYVIVHYVALVRQK